MGSRKSFPHTSPLVSIPVAVMLCFILVYIDRQFLIGYATEFAQPTELEMSGS